MITTLVREEKSNYQSSGGVDYDGLWKKLIGDLFAELIAFFAPDLYDEIDFSLKPEFLQQELHKLMIEDRKGKGIVDQIVKVKLKDRTEKWILVHIEVQDNPEEDFSKRMFRYFYRILDKYETEIYAIALITDLSQTKPKNHYQYSFHGTNLVYMYNVYKYDERNLNELKKSSNPFSHAIVAGIYAKKHKTNLKQKTEIKKVLLQQVLLRYSSDHNKSETYLEALTYFINFLFDLPKHNEEEVYSELEDFVKRSDINMNTEMPKRSPVLDELGRRLAGDYAEETRKEGIEEGIKKVAKKLIEKNFSNEQIVEITEIPLEEIKELRETNK